MDSLDHAVSLVKLPFAGNTGIDHGAIIPGTDDDRVVGLQLCFQACDQLKLAWTFCRFLFLSRRSLLNHASIWDPFGSHQNQRNIHCVKKCMSQNWCQ